jgi:hypothetical protein
MSYWRERWRAAGWSLDFRRDCVIAVLVGIASWWLAHGLNSWENVWIPLLGAFIGVALYEVTGFTWRFLVTAPRTMYLEVERQRDEARGEAKQLIEASSDWIIDAQLPVTAWGETYIQVDIVLLLINRSRTDAALLEFAFGVSERMADGTSKSFQFFEDHSNNSYEPDSRISSLSPVPPQGYIYGHLLFTLPSAPGHPPAFGQGESVTPTLVISDRVSGKERKVVPTGQKIVCRDFSGSK